MNTKNNQASGFGKKTYAQPEMKVYEVSSTTILAGSGTEPKTTNKNEEYEVGSTDTWGWSNPNNN